MGSLVYNTVEYDLDYVFQSSLLIKPLFGGMQTYASALSYHVMRGKIIFILFA